MQIFKQISQEKRDSMETSGESQSFTCEFSSAKQHQTVELPTGSMAFDNGFHCNTFDSVFATTANFLAEAMLVVLNLKHFTAAALGATRTQQNSASSPSALRQNVLAHKVCKCAAGDVGLFASGQKPKSNQQIALASHQQLRFTMQLSKSSRCFSTCTEF